MLRHGQGSNFSEHDGWLAPFQAGVNYGVYMFYTPHQDPTVGEFTVFISTNPGTPQESIVGSWYYDGPSLYSITNTGRVLDPWEPEYTPLIEFGLYASDPQTGLTAEHDKIVIQELN